MNLFQLVADSAHCKLSLKNASFVVYAFITPFIQMVAVCNTDFLLPTTSFT